MTIDTSKSHKTRYLAGGSLGVMAAGFAGTLPWAQSPLTGILHAGFEAGLIGGAADWFAVTALFRHPLGIPIPHTALLPRNRAKMTNGLVQLLEQQLLAKETIVAKLRDVHLMPALLAWARQASQQALARGDAASLLQTLIRDIPADQLAAALTKLARQALDRVDTAVLARQALHLAYEQRLDAKLLDFVLDRAKEWINTPEMKRQMGGSILQLVNRLNLGGIMQFAVNAFISYLDEDKLGAMMQQFVLDKINQLQSATDEQRAALLVQVREALERLIEGLPDNEQVPIIKAKIIDALSLEQRMQNWVEQGQVHLIRLVSDEQFPERAQGYVDRMFTKLEHNAALIERLENGVKYQIADLIQQHHGQIGTIVRENIDKLNTRQLTNLIEEKVGGDLQWIRVNGAICGFLIGIALQTFKTLLG